ncbi:lyase family protein, partial [Listeria monocytogenes]|uniref:lyase family protein n=1 Tax=Listeria monocytogenes TaxID=1639 RepID=UPI003C6D186F
MCEVPLSVLVTRIILILQRAQPIRWSHWLLSYLWQFQNDWAKLQQWSKNMNQCPLGSGALAGHPFDNFDREALATSLSFDSVI